MAVRIRREELKRTGVTVRGEPYGGALLRVACRLTGSKGEAGKRTDTAGTGRFADVGVGGERSGDEREKDGGSHDDNCGWSMKN